MITPELIGYIRGEFAKGRTREDIHKTLSEGGGWSEADLSEAFRIVIPMQGFTASPPSSLSLKTQLSSPRLRIIVVGVVIALFCLGAWYFFGPQIKNFWNATMNNVRGFSVPSFNFDKIFSIDKAPAKNNTIVKNVNPVKNCGTSIAPDLKNPLLYKDDAVLNCLGNSALSCTPARAVLEDALFPTIFQITKENTKDPNVCNFRLSYGPESTLVDITGKKLALQSISCPVGIVKALDESSSETIVFKAPSLDNSGKYASQIYFYGTLGLFIEQGIDKTKIQNLGCSGSYIDSVVASFKKMQSQTPK